MSVDSSPLHLSAAKRHHGAGQQRSAALAALPVCRMSGLRGVVNTLNRCSSAVESKWLAPCDPTAERSDRCACGSDDSDGRRAAARCASTGMIDAPPAGSPAVDCHSNGSSAACARCCCAVLVPLRRIGTVGERAKNSETHRRPVSQPSDSSRSGQRGFSTLRSVHTRWRDAHSERSVEVRLSFDGEKMQTAPTAAVSTLSASGFSKGTQRRPRVILLMTLCHATDAQMRSSGSGQA